MNFFKRFVIVRFDNMYNYIIQIKNFALQLGL